MDVLHLLIQARARVSDVTAAFPPVRAIHCAAALLVTLMIFAHAAASAESISFTTDTHRIVFESCDPAIVEWETAADVFSEKPEWKSIVTRDAAGQPLSKHVYLAGMETAASCQCERIEPAGVVFECSTHDGRFIVRTVFEAESDYRLIMRVAIENRSHEAVSLPNGFRLQIGPGLGEYPAAGFGIAEKMYSFVEPVISYNGNVLRIQPDDDSVALSAIDTLDWYGLHSRYFALLLSPLGEYANSPLHLNIDFQTDEDDSGIPSRYLPLVSVNLSIDSIGPLQSIDRAFIVFSGPKSSSVLRSGKPDFGGLLFAGLWKWMEAVCLGLLWLLKAIHRFIPSWGISIIVLAVVVRIVLYPFARRAMAGQKAFADVQKVIQPEMSRIKRDYKGGDQSEKILELYKVHGVSPLAGLKPLLIVLIQLPVFVALFHVLGRAYELRDASFLWIPSLSEPDRTFRFWGELPFFGMYFNVLPVLMAVTTLLTIKMAPAPAADTSSGVRQNIFLILMAMTFFLLFYTFPSGMVLYWTMANVLHLLQHCLVEKLSATKNQQRVAP